MRHEAGLMRPCEARGVRAHDAMQGGVGVQAARGTKRVWCYRGEARGAGTHGTRWVRPIRTDWRSNRSITVHPISAIKP
jgi:hypothetical protein